LRTGAERGEKQDQKQSMTNTQCVHETPYLIRANVDLGDSHGQQKMSRLTQLEGNRCRVITCAI
jgi:hypothetical protein